MYVAKNCLKLFLKIKNIELWGKVLIGLISGSILGYFLGENALKLSFIKVLFLNLIKMLVPLLIFASMTMGITSIKDPKKLGRLGLKTFALYLLTTLIAIFIGFGIAHVIKPGINLNLKNYQSSPKVIEEVKDLKFLNLLLSIVPDNLLSAFYNSQYVQIIFFSIFLGWAINSCGDRGKPLLKSIRSLVDVLYKMLAVVMQLTPYAVFAMMAVIVGEHGFQILIGLSLYIFCVYMGCIIHLLVTNAFLVIKVIGKLNPIHFFKGMKDAAIISFSTASSNATLSTTIYCVEEKLGVSKNIAHFVLPLGATVNMDGAALGLACMSVFIAQANGIDLTINQYLTIVITVTLSAIGAAGIPGGGGAVMPVVLSAAGLPLDGVTALWGVNHIREMASTTTNILGDAAVAVVIAKSENELDEEKYNEAINDFEESNL